MSYRNWPQLQGVFWPSSGEEQPHHPMISWQGCVYCPGQTGHCVYQQTASSGGTGWHWG